MEWIDRDATPTAGRPELDLFLHLHSLQSQKLCLRVTSITTLFHWVLFIRSSESARTEAVDAAGGAAVRPAAQFLAPSDAAREEPSRTAHRLTAFTRSSFFHFLPSIYPKREVFMIDAALPA